MWLDFITCVETDSSDDTEQHWDLLDKQGQTKQIEQWVRAQCGTTEMKKKAQILQKAPLHLAICENIELF